METIYDLRLNFSTTYYGYNPVIDFLDYIAIILALDISIQLNYNIGLFILGGLGNLLV